MRLLLSLVLRGGYHNRDPLEPDLIAAQKVIEWCEHLVVVHPVWWGQMPAELKGFFDRTFIPGWAFKFHEGKVWWERLLAGRSARIIQTSAVPNLLMRLWYGNCAKRALKKQHAEILRRQSRPSDSVWRSRSRVHAGESKTLGGSVRDTWPSRKIVPQ